MTPQQLFVPRVLCVAIAISSLLMGYVGFTMLGGKDLDAFDVGAVTNAASSQQAMFLMLGAVALVASVVLPKMFARMRPASSHPLPMLQRAFPPFVVGLALAEACAIFGVLSVQMRVAPPEMAFVHAIPAALVIALFHFPTEARISALAGG